MPGVTRCINGAVQQVCDDPELEPDTTCDGVDQIATVELTRALWVSSPIAGSATVQALDSLNA